MQINDAKVIIEELLEKLTVAVNRVEVSLNDPHPIINIVTPDSGILIGAQGENLRSLNYIVKKIVEIRATKVDGGSPTSLFLIDVNNYHRKHILLIRQQSHILSERARTFRSDVAMDAMNAYDRMIVHELFADDKEIQTESVGFGKERHIVFKYKKPKETISASDRILFAKEKMR